MSNFKEKKNVVAEVDGILTGGPGVDEYIEDNTHPDN